MASSLVIVESPAKAKTLKKYLGRGFDVLASKGHILDLPKSDLGVDIEHGFEPTYYVTEGKEQVIEDLKKAAEKADTVFLAPDPDREGEAIAWHIRMALEGKAISPPPKGRKKAASKKAEKESKSTLKAKSPKKAAKVVAGKEPDGDGKAASGKTYHRVLFNEITKKAVQEAIAHPVTLDSKKYDSQQARRVLDRLVGYKISPILWNKVRRGLSAGRVQSVAVRLIVEREKEIRAFTKEEYWTIGVQCEGPVLPSFTAQLSRVDGQTISIDNEKTARKITDELSRTPLKVTKVIRRERRRQAPGPFTTSKLQQDAARKLRFTTKRTMSIAQKLYEGISLGDEGLVGLITYMRTDSVRISNDAIEAVRGYIGTKFGKEFLPEQPNIYKNKSNAQDAHEAIRPTSVDYPPEKVEQFLSKEEFDLYELIWKRFVACQMAPAVYDQTSVEITGGRFGLRVSGSVMKSPGFTAIYKEDAEEKVATQKPKGDTEVEEEEDKEKVLPPLAEGDVLKTLGVNPEQHFTQPPPRFTEASLVKEMEEKGIGRPSTYASIISVIQDKAYCEKIENRFHPTHLGEQVTELLVENFGEIVDVNFTAGMEAKLDQIEEGNANFAQTIQDFYGPFEKTLAHAAEHMRDLKRQEIPTDIPCKLCGSKTVIKWGRMGEFIACTNYPECSFTSDFKRQADGSLKLVDPVEEFGAEAMEPCDLCGSPVTLRKGRFGPFIACTNYPSCKFTRKIVKKAGNRMGVEKVEAYPGKCELCGKGLVVKRAWTGNRFVACEAYPSCKFAKSFEIGVPCPKCGKEKGGQLVERTTKRRRMFYGCNRYPDCDFTTWDKPIPEPCPKCASTYVLEKFTKTQGRFLKCPNQECDFERELLDENPEAGSEAPLDAAS